MLFEYDNPFNGAFPAAMVAAGGTLRILWLRSRRNAALRMAAAFTAEPWRLS